MRWAYIALFVVLVGAVVAQNVKMTKAERKAERKAARMERRQNKKNNKECKYDKKAARQNPCADRVAALLADVSEASCAATIPFPCKCKYKRQPAKCSNPEAGTTTVQLKNAKREPNCPPTTEYPCAACKYNKKAARKQPCDNRVADLLADISDASCDATIPFPCNGRRKNGKRGRKPGKRRKAVDRKAGRGAACKYWTTGWSDCHPATNMKTNVKTLKRGDPDVCNATLTIQKVCIKGKVKPGVCRYRPASWGQCDHVTNIKTMVKPLKRGDPATCPPTQTKDKICKRKHKGLKNNKCKYSRTEWSECDLATDMITMEMTLKKGDPSSCPPTDVLTRKCKKNKKHGKTEVKGCKYNKSQWGPCDAATNTVTVTLTLKQGDPAVCNATRTQTKKCKDKHLRPHVCKYRRSSWGDCDPVTNMKQMVKTLKRGDPAHCEPTHVVERKCKRKRAITGKSTICKYKFEAWSECDIATNTMVRRQTLKSGPSTCQDVKEYARKCKKPCHFRKGTWSACDVETNLMTRNDTIVKGSADFCGATRILTQKCGRKKKCQYDFGMWSDCDVDTNKRTRTRMLVTGDEECAEEKISRKTCSKSNGEGRCFFGPWGDYDVCKNGVQKKRRQVLSGGLECEKRGVKMIAC